MRFKAYYSCNVQLFNEDYEPYKGIEELDSVYLDFIRFELGDDWVTLDIGDADGLDYEPDENGRLSMGGSFNCECDEDLVFDDNFNPTDFEIEFYISYNGQEVDYNTEDIVVSFWINGEVKDFR